MDDRIFAALDTLLKRASTTGTPEADKDEIINISTAESLESQGGALWNRVTTALAILDKRIVPFSPGTHSEVLAEKLFLALVGQANATLPAIDLTDGAFNLPWTTDSDVFKPVSKVTIEELVADFNALMGGAATQIAKEFDAGRITGAKYAETYLAMMQAAMGTAVQFVLGKDQAFWMAAKTQADAITAKTNLEIAKLEAMLRRATYALTKLKLATEDSQFGQSEFQRQEILPAQKTLVSEQAESQRAQTLDTRADALSRADGSNLQGLLGIQKTLYKQQVQSYKDDSQLKAAKVFSDLWVTQKTVSEDTEPSKYFSAADVNKPLDAIFRTLRITAMNGEDDQL